MKPVDDRELVRRVAQSDRDAFAELFRRYAPRVRGYLVASIGTHSAEELTQEVMLRIWRKAPTYDPNLASPTTWVFTIARNARIDHFRRQGRIEPELDDPTFVPSTPDSPDDAARRLDEGRRIATALEGLPEPQSDVVRRAYLHGESLPEVAAALGIPLGTVKSRLRLALERLRLSFLDD